MRRNREEIKPMSVKQFAILASISLSLMTAAVPSSRAATSTAAIAVSATVAPSCQVGSSTDRAGTERRAHTLAVTCEMSVPYSVTYEDSAATYTRAFAGTSDETMGRVAATVTY